ncbi:MULTISPECIES: S-adenosylmethionine:tRNA ribosyltransferase-isomerase [Macellibacteroides]|uniref:S-adenosylmethionine:tRNA ribosyltransferase-isomerase n=1 Tax=Parabacteroides chartae TaxID=1037355 RepID=A0A1T5D547_9BACT|nr:S-adenosylmethionine:tRNA ribosyltransferase-isomerase [Parabacteroides chartae]SKB66663.1 S-adenosylmethionine:tRNA ribosyltransferase-isomerase [Parabacteroides chartae]HML71345.1 S-adenosylmethionine:tRNA ribosyltransferase-isomerase [Macellibacteroides fermentans]HNP90654.1 S-adenosylmethionine:tRNA ribosyltransferase-isomerase [Macellibacteroides fermentans]
MTAKTEQIRIEEFNYPLPDERIAKFPLTKRDESKLLVYRNGKIDEAVFKQLSDYLPQGSMLVYNNTRVIQARMLFQKETGAQIEVFCLEPVIPHDYALVFQQTESCSWLCLVGNLKKWKEGALHKTIRMDDKEVVLSAERIKTTGDSHLVRFSWNNPQVTFAELLDAAGILPIPPYLHRETRESDLQTYQTVYSKIKGSVAAPTAGLHFTPEVLAGLDAKGFTREEVTLHVGAGTFKPVKSEVIGDHEMHTEFISVRRSAIENIRTNLGRIIAVGTTSVRTLESLYYMGRTLVNNPDATSEELVVTQWTPYHDTEEVTAHEALTALLDYLDRNQTDTLLSATQIMIAPGYEFKIVKGIITNFHQPKSTLLLLISAFVNGNWKSIYNYALDNDFRFLSYGDSSLLL